VLIKEYVADKTYVKNRAKFLLVQHYVLQIQIDLWLLAEVADTRRQALEVMMTTLAHDRCTNSNKGIILA